MSARNRRKAIKSENPFSQPLDIRAADAELFGAIEDADRHYQAIETLDIFGIFPDPTQPRRAVPSTIRLDAAWDGTADTLPRVFEVWLTAIEKERGEPFDLEGHLHATSETPRSDENHETDDTGPMEMAFLKLTDLAGSILREGLTNPITVARQGEHYQLETGERRWLAYTLLYMQLEDEIWRHIPARLVNKVDIWRQAAENNARSDLNAISRARQLAVLLMDLRREHYNDEFQPYENLVTDKSDRAYYAQVANGEVYRVPRGTGEKLLAATGLKDASQIRQYRRLLELPDIVWQIADDLSWTENHLRDMRKKAEGDNWEMAQMAAIEAHNSGYTVTGVTVSRDAVPPEAPKKSRQGEQLILEPGSKAYFGIIYQTLKRASRDNVIETQRAIWALEKHRRWIDGELDRLREMME